MNPAVLVISLAAATFALAKIGVSFVAALRLRQIARSEPPDDAALHSTALVETGFSVVVFGFQSVDNIIRRLSIDYDAYELIVVTDLDSADHSELFGCYHLVRMRPFDNSELRCGRIELYRSRKKRYSRLVVVNHTSESRSGLLQCAAAIARYDQLIPLEGHRFLRRDSLRRLSAELERNACGKAAGISLDPTPHSADECVGYANFTLMSAIGIEHGGIVSVVGRDAVLEGKIHGNPTLHGLSRVGIIADSECDSRKPPSRNRVAVVAAAVWIATLIVAIVSADRVSLGTLLLAALTLYTALAASGVLAVAAVSSLQNNHRGNSELHVGPKTLFIYPLLSIFRTIKGRKFR